jgi:hypothetical protein
MNTYAIIIRNSPIMSTYKISRLKPIQNEHLRKKHPGGGVGLSNGNGVVGREKAVAITALFARRKVRAAKARGNHVAFAA